MQPLSLSVVRKHCVVVLELDESGEDAVVGEHLFASVYVECAHLTLQVPNVFPGSVCLIAGKGETFHNGRKLMKQEKVALHPFDRVIIGGELLLFRHSADPADYEQEPPSAEEAVLEYQRALSSGRGRRRSVEVQALESQLQQLQIEKAKAEAAGNMGAAATGDEDFAQLMRLVDTDIQVSSQCIMCPPLLFIT
jgi:hypothetical protein